MPTTLAPSKSFTIVVASGGERRAGLRRVGAQTPVLGRGRLVRKSMDLSNGRTSAAGGDRAIRDLRLPRPGRAQSREWLLRRAGSSSTARPADEHQPN